MFGFLNMQDDYEDRKVGRDEFEWGMVSTARVTDGSKPYETAVEHKEYGDGMVIVESYDTKDAAAAGHKRWVKTMTAAKLPIELKDCYNAGVAQLLLAVGGSADKKLNKGKKK